MPVKSMADDVSSPLLRQKPMPPADRPSPAAPRHIAAILPEVLARYGLSPPAPAPTLPAAKSPPLPAPPVSLLLLAAAHSDR
jgi:hypothetical protein